ncbi:phosphatase PAP2 family protein [Rhodoferax saidenbachensis]|uniref:Phosphatase PAP2 family protein n=1 Tax=Rhodoferax saidenbachensis TaxID=1484693 RepID=A0A1P8KEG1_9BURK|nr:phosphatase PAP2 family protein [Rhodoferax saidenbachensis]APW44356.1 phosphatase PAP2 family protein [Rhodoferax saidenbachensis]
MSTSQPVSAVPATPTVPRWVWWLPLVIFGVSAPLWLHWTEPGLFLAINRWCAPVAAPVWTGLSLLGNAWGILGVTAPLLVLAPRLLWAWLCAAPFAIVFARTGKFFIESPRPAAEVDNAQMRIVGELLHNVSMPSGHTLTAFAVASGIYFALPVARRWRHAWLLLLAAGAGLSRIAVGAHWPGDVMVGAALGLLSGLLGQLLLQRVPAAWYQAQSWALRTVALLVVAAGYTLVTDALDFAENQPVQYLLAVVVLVALLGFVQRSFMSKKGL